MYMGPIIAADVQPGRPSPIMAQAARVPAHPVLRMAVGIPVLLLAALVMLPWAAVIAVSAGVFLGVRSILAVPRAVVQAADYAGRIALGR